jgi:hypothetical protein
MSSTPPCRTRSALFYLVRFFLCVPAMRPLLQGVSKMAVPNQYRTTTSPPLLGHRLGHCALRAHDVYCPIPARPVQEERPGLVPRVCLEKPTNQAVCTESWCCHPNATTITLTTYSAHVMCGGGREAMPALPRLGDGFQDELAVFRNCLEDLRSRQRQPCRRSCVAAVFADRQDRSSIFNLSARMRCSRL